MSYKILHNLHFSKGGFLYGGAYIAAAKKLNIFFHQMQRMVVM